MGYVTVRGCPVEKLLGRAQVAELLGISLPTLWRMTHVKRVLPYLRVGERAVKFRRADVEAYLNSRANKAGR